MVTPVPWISTFGLTYIHGEGFLVLLLCGFIAVFPLLRKKAPVWQTHNFFLAEFQVHEFL
jgi:hypothetical protein